MWYFKSPGRLQREKELIGDLEAQESWLRNVRWRLEGMQVVVDAEILCSGTVREVVVRFHEGFPDFPPSVLPVKKERWSAHQYGDGGELCLEYGPDNWVPTLSAADLLRSAYKLLQQEGTEAGAAVPVPSRHSVTAGQSTRTSRVRLVVTSACHRELLTATGVAPAVFVTRFRESAFVVVPRVLRAGSSAEWTDLSVPSGEADFFRSVNGFVVVSDSLPKIDVDSGAKAVRELLLGDKVQPAPSGESEGMVVVANGQISLYYLLPSGTVVTTDAVIVGDSAERSAKPREKLSGRRVAILGLGSIGSKVAASLCRFGVDKFCLFDEQALEPGNVVRNDLDWDYVGLHKADAVSARLKMINPMVDVQVRKLRIGGQEASSSLASALKQLTECEIIVDATASAEPFMLAATAARTSQRTMLWAEVFQGGIGGIVARSRPGVDPSPLVARNLILQWCSEQNVPAPPRPAHRYEGGSPEAPLLADDADVNAVSAHLTRMTLDCMRNIEQPEHRSSAYVIGLRAEWLFNEPFDTRAINLGSPEPAEPAFDPNEPLTAKGVQTILQLIGDIGAPANKE